MLFAAAEVVGYDITKSLGEQSFADARDGGVHIFLARGNPALLVPVVAHKGPKIRKCIERECLFLGPVSAEKIRVSIVNYTNTLPFKWALKRSSLLQKIALQEDIPSICAQKLKFGQADLALVPVALLPELTHYHIVSRYCIGAKDKVETVKLYSNVPREQIRSVGLDYQSKTSNALSRVLFHHFWKQRVEFMDSLPGFEAEIKGAHAIVVIGDRTFELNGKFPYEFDLAEEWLKATGLPIVFAESVSVKPLNSSF